MNIFRKIFKKKETINNKENSKENKDCCSFKEDKNEEGDMNGI